MISPVQGYLEDIYQRHLPITEGVVASYIPELAKADPGKLAICVVTATGGVYEVGASRHPFTIQSISKPFVYGLALEDNGRAPVLEKVGVEPTGDAFNSISLDPKTGRPSNPMINAGAITSAGLVQGKTCDVRFDRILEMAGLYAGRSLVINERAYNSDRETGHRNRAIGHMLRNFNMIEGDPDDVVDLYFRQCSIEVTCRDLAVMAATLANRGVNPVTGRQALRGEYVESVLSVMSTCGMYDFAGSWIYRIGMPAKSGVSGGVIAVLPGQVGIGVFSPPLDEKGNSVRGIRICDELSRRFDLHVFNRPGSAQSAVRTCYSGSQISSSRVRTAAEAQVLHRESDAIRVYQLQGNLSFVTTDVMIQDLMVVVDAVRHVVVDLRRVLSVNESACRLFYDLMECLAGQGKTLLLAHSARFPLLRRFFKAKLGERFEKQFRSFEETDLAMEWCEDRLLEESLPHRGELSDIAPGEYELFAGFEPEEVRLMETLLVRRTYQRGEVVVLAGDEAGYIYLVARGTASVVIGAEDGATRRLATFSRGMAFGEMAVIDRAPRSATVLADSELSCDLLSAAAFEQLGGEHPRVKVKLLENLCLSLSQKLRRTNRELSVFE